MRGGSWQKTPGNWVGHEDITGPHPCSGAELGSREVGGARPGEVQWGDGGVEEPRNRVVFRLGLGEVGRVEHNGRFAPVGAWTYRPVVATIGWWSARISDSLITSTPDHDHYRRGERF